MSMLGGPNAQAIMTAQANYNRALKQGTTSQEDLIKLQQKVQGEQDRAKTQAAAAAEAEKAMRDLGADIYTALMPALKLLSELANQLVKDFGAMGKEGLKPLETAIKLTVDWFRQLLDPATRQKAIDDLVNNIGKMLGTVFQKIWENFSFFGKAPQEDANAETAPAAANGAVLSGPRSGFDAILHGTEAVVPLPDGRNIPVSLDLNMPKALNFQQPDTASLVAEMQKMQTQKQNQNPFGNLEETFANFFSNKPEPADADITGKILITELQTLNKQTAEMLAYVRDTADTGRRSIDALRGLSGNLYPV